MTSVNSLCFSAFNFLRGFFRSIFCVYFALETITNVVFASIKHSFFGSHLEKVENHVFIKRHFLSHCQKASANPSCAVINRRTSSLFASNNESSSSTEEHQLFLQAATNVHHRLKNIICV